MEHRAAGRRAAGAAGWRGVRRGAARGRDRRRSAGGPATAGGHPRNRPGGRCAGAVDHRQLRRGRRVAWRSLAGGPPRPRRCGAVPGKGRWPRPDRDRGRDVAGGRDVMPTRRLLAALLAVASIAAVASAAPITPTDGPVTASRDHAAQPDADAFDALAADLDRGGLAAATPDQARDQLARLRRLLPPGDPRRDLRYRYLACGAERSDAGSTITLATRGIADARTLEDTHAQVRFLYCRAGARASVAPPDRTLGDWEAGLAMARANRDWRLVADGLVGRGHMRSLAGEHARALNDFLTAQQLYRTTGHDALARENALNLGIAYRRMGDLEEARTQVRLALDAATQRDDWGTRCNALLQLGYLYEDLDQLAHAQATYEQALNLAPRGQARSPAGAARLALGGVLIARDQHATALETLDQAERELAGTTDTGRSGLLRMRRGQALAGLGRQDEALREYEAAERLMEQQDNERYLAMLLPARAEALEASGQTGRALAEYRRFIQLEGKLLDDSARQRATAM